MFNKKKSQILFFIILIIISLYLFLQFNMEIKELTINKEIIKVEVAKTVSAQAKGLANRESLDNNQGMLFIYPDSKIRHFWMKDMNFPIDIIWLNDKKVVGVEENVPVWGLDGQISRVASNLPVDAVLEVKAGFFASKGLKIGDMVYGLD